MQIEESSNTGKPWIALKMVLGDCAGNDRTGILFNKRKTPIIEYGMEAKDAIENTKSVSFLLS